MTVVLRVVVDTCPRRCSFNIHGCVCCFWLVLTLASKSVVVVVAVPVARSLTFTPSSRMQLFVLEFSSFCSRYVSFPWFCPSIVSVRVLLVLRLLGFFVVR